MLADIEHPFIRFALDAGINLNDASGVELEAKRHLHNKAAIHSPQFIPSEQVRGEEWERKNVKDRQKTKGSQSLGILSAARFVFFLEVFLSRLSLVWPGCFS
jgi:hypothetical protein